MDREEKEEREERREGGGAKWLFDPETPAIFAEDFPILVDTRVGAIVSSIFGFFGALLASAGAEEGEASPSYFRFGLGWFSPRLNARRVTVSSPPRSKLGGKFSGYC